jgi:hypothetical protein
MHKIASLVFEGSLGCSSSGLQPVKELVRGKGTREDLVCTRLDQVEMQTAGAWSDKPGDRYRPGFHIGLQGRTEFRGRPVPWLTIHDHGNRGSLALRQWLVGREQLAVETGDTENVAEHQEEIRIPGVDQDTWPHEWINLQRFLLQPDYRANSRGDNMVSRCDA